ncbi:MAG: alpha/beta fold hydrolase [Armatimonadetes bacterium]|nr:alpha/beta fold hydrolase [Armatimonadota bacterium]
MIGTSSEGPWALTEHLRDDNPNFVQRNFHPRQTHRNPAIVAAFGSATPHSGEVLLHYAGDPPPGVPRREVPVILVHGATKNANFWWDPHEDGSERGFAQHLRDRGFQVYAVTFAHSQDDNFLWAQQVANAIDRVKEKTGADKVDLVGHSKGGVPVRMYVSDVREPWMTPYRRDVRRVLLAAAPNGGIDFSFRHPVANYALVRETDNPRLNAPTSWERALLWGRYQDVSELGFGSSGPDYFPGQRQLLARWDGRYSLTPLEPDWFTTYHGGQGIVSSSRGIARYIEEGGNLIERLGRTPIHPDVEVAVLAGNQPNVPGILNEYTGPSDGLLFVESALKLPEESRVVAEAVLPLHHKALISEPEGQAWMTEVLEAEHLEPLEKRTLEETLEGGLVSGKDYLEPARERAMQEAAHIGASSVDGFLLR